MEVVEVLDGGCGGQLQVAPTLEGITAQIWMEFFGLCHGKRNEPTFQQNCSQQAT